MRPGAARAGHLLVALVAGGAVLFQLVLVVNGSATLLPEGEPTLAVRLGRFVSYFTILSNVLVAAVAWPLVRDPGYDGRVWRVLRLDAVVAIAVTGVVHWFLLRPLLDLDGADWLADKLLHVVVPVLAVGAWLLLGPRRRTTWADLLPALTFPVAWLGLTLARGAVTGWYPYPFLDAGDLGYPMVLVTSVGVALLLTGLAAAAIALDPWLERRAAA